jgi:hypothetical protein
VAHFLIVDPVAIPEAETTPEAEAFDFQVVWQRLDETPVRTANQFIVQIGGPGMAGPEEFVVSIGYAAPPVLVGTPEQQREFADAIGHTLPALPIARFTLTRSTAEYLATALRKSIERFDEIVEIEAQKPQPEASTTP